MSSAASSPLTLYTFTMSHYSEKIRWTLDHCGIPYRERFMTPVFHMVPALLMGRRGETTLPILRCGDEAIQDSPRILDWLQAHKGPLDVMPEHVMRQVREVEQRFDAIGHDVALSLYASSFGLADDHIVRLWTEQGTPMQAAFIQRWYPVIRWGFSKKLGITRKGAIIAQQRISEVMDWLESQLADGRTYLVDDRFTVADITAASLLAPIACPRQHPVYGDAAYREGMASAIAPWRSRSCLQWVRCMYDLERGPINPNLCRRPLPAAR